MDQIEGGIVCYKDPETCVDNGKRILSKLKSVDSDVKFVLDKIKYKIKPDFCAAYFYRVSDDKWYSPGPGSNCSSLNVSFFIVSSTLLSYNMSAM